jgi:peptide deformylase
MALRPIRLYPDPVLREVGRTVETFDDSLRQLAADMIETMHAAPGVGLAAQQVGVPLRLCVVDVSAGQDGSALHVLVNPRVTESEGAELGEEGCLSIPGFTEKLERPDRVVVEAVNLENRPVQIVGEGLLARALVHELDHLEGILFVDRLRGLRRERAKRFLKRMPVVEAGSPP